MPRLRRLDARSGLQACRVLHRRGADEGIGGWRDEARHHAPAEGRRSDHARDRARPVEHDRAGSPLLERGHEPALRHEFRRRHDGPPALARGEEGDEARSFRRSRRKAQRRRTADACRLDYREVAGFRDDTRGRALDARLRAGVQSRGRREHPAWRHGEAGQRESRGGCRRPRGGGGRSAIRPGSTALPKGWKLLAIATVIRSKSPASALS